MRILGIDVGTRLVGWAVFDGRASGATALIAHGLMQLPGETVFNRLTTLENLWRQRFRQEAAVTSPYGVLPAPEWPAPEWLIDGVAIEQQFSKMNHSDRVLGVASWLIQRAAWEAGWQVVEISAPTARKIVLGSGALKKDQVKAMLEERFGVTFSTADVSDALLVAMAAAQARFELASAEAV